MLTSSSTSCECCHCVGWGIFTTADLIGSEKHDYWSYNLIKETIGANYNKRDGRIWKIFNNDGNLFEYGIDLAAIGLTEELFNWSDNALAKRVLSAISPWLYGDDIPNSIKELVKS